MIDLRLVPTAVGAWAAAWWVTGAPGPSPDPGPGSGVPLLGGLLLVLLVVRPARRCAALPHVALAATGILAVLLSGHVHHAGRVPLVALAGAGAMATVTGTVVSEPEPVRYGPWSAGGAARPFAAVSGSPDLRWRVAVRTVTARGVTSAARAVVEVTAPGSVVGPAYGAEATVTGRLRPSEPGDAAAARLCAAEPADARPAEGLHAATRSLRVALLAVTDDLSPQARGLVPGAAIGDTSRVPPELDEAMLVSGLTHVTAVSGSHFAVVVTLLTGLGATLRMPRAGRVALVALAAGWFVALVRPEPSVLRAAAMTAFALAGTVLGRPSQAVPALAGTVVGLLVLDPWLARSFGFALSAAATAGLVLLTAPLAARMAPWIGGPPAFALAVPLAAQAACGPVLVLLDPSVSTVAVLANLLAAPAVVPATLLGLGATLLAPWLPGLAHGVAWTAGGATWWVAEVARWSAALPGASVPWLGGLRGAVVLAGLTGVVLGVVLRRGPSSGWPPTWRAAVRSGLREAPAVRHRRSRQGRLVVVAAAVSTCVLVVAVAVPRVVRLGGMPQDWQVVACDVGQGDAVVLRSGPTSAVVVDVGPDGTSADRCLDRLGVTAIDLLILSHFHADHVGGLRPVLEGRTVTGALVSPVDDPPTAAEVTRAVLAEAGVPVRDAQAGDHGAAGTVAWEVLQSGAGPGSGEGSANDGSVALAARTADLDVLLLGDLETAGQAALVEVLRERPAPGWSGSGSEFDVVKVAHHGSAEQSAELATITSPVVALVSAGRHNDYGHPTDQALDLYAGVGAAVVRTDECGTTALVVRDAELGVSGC